MADEEEDYRGAEQVATILLDVALKRDEPITDETVERILDQVLAIRDFKHLDRDRLRSAVERRVNVAISSPQILEDLSDHVPWLPEKKSSVTWAFWERYRRYLNERKGRPVNVIQALDSRTDMVLERLEDPTDHDRPFDRRGMVVGHVQSGKTENFTGLMCKAADAGYNLILVLAGPHNNLRSQTQMRLDEEFLGYDTSKTYTASPTGSRVGVGTLTGEEFLAVQSLTNRNNDGDFKVKVAASVLVDLGTIPTLLVVKKNATVLRTVKEYFQGSSWARPDSTLGHPVIDRVPLLIIDDECDLASVNTKEVPVDEDGNRSEDYNPTVINQLIREILMTFRQKAYVGYTATPFANIFIYSDDKHRELGPDLFPRHFIISLPPPSNYIGPEQLFGLDKPDAEPLPLLRPVADHIEFMPDRHKKDHVPRNLPPSMREALRAFVLLAAIRRVRGQGNQHSSMLIHVTRYTDVQAQVSRLVTAELDDLRTRLRYGDGGSTSQVRQEFQSLWERDFLPASQSMGGTEPAETWDKVDLELVPAVEKTRIVVINGTAGDILDYKTYESTGINVVVIGGDKLSRGMTLEGLSVSYFLRATKMYDTLMQMGRWFGYRENYLDLCRIYTTDELADWYRSITEANQELRQDFELMVARGETPASYGLRVRSHPILLVTSPVKMRSGETLELSYAGNISEVVVFDIADDAVKHNFEVTEGFVRNLPGAAISRGGYLLWQNVPSGAVMNYLASLRTHRRAFRANGKLLADYIGLQVKHGELTSWSVALIDKSASESGDLGEEPSAREGGAIVPSSPLSIGGHDVEATIRRPIADLYRPRQSVSIKRLVSPRHEEIDLSVAERAKAVDGWRSNRGGEPSQQPPEPLPGPWIRAGRDKEHGLLLLYPLDPGAMKQRLADKKPDLPPLNLPRPLIGFAVSFPASGTAQLLKYEVNNVYWEQEYA